MAVCFMKEVENKRPGIKNGKQLKAIYSDSFIIGDVEFKLFFDHAFSDDEFDIAYFQFLNKGEMFHYHAYYEIMFVFEGVVEIVSNEEKYILNSGDVILIPIGAVHFSKISYNCKYLTLGFEMERAKNIDKYSRIFKRLYMLLNKSIFNIKEMDITNKGKQMIDLLKSEFSLKAFHINTIFQEIIFSICRYIENRYFLYEKDDKNTNLFNFKQVLNRKITSLDSPTRLKDIAYEMNLSERQLSRIIKTLYGGTFCEIKTYLRIESAKRMLVETDLSIEKISEEVFFISVPSFIKKFKQITNKTPLQYRKEHKSK